MTIYYAILATVLLAGGEWANAQEGESHIRVRRGNFGERYSGGIGPGSAHGVGYGGTTSLGGHTGGGGGGPPFDHITLKAVSGANDQFIASYQANQNAGASSAGALDNLQQQGQHTAAYAGRDANQVGSWYNAIATGPVPAGYKGENRRRRR
ncbi:heterogeneous nuclear ribonucleoprotein A3 homolog 2 [Folsomia candida]|uniref:Uncharacterized protein n=1 Tax=Folsomia candida TaxID=158441 RepID=A0A226DXF1_FOLCA|nr:heterogeneous nuclear ribonucleoprotein A3 homolog 2 [Folsomia candida]OXA50155.1 hypothetical protein Fcan01_15078 [Folsomia candida]